MSKLESENQKPLQQNPALERLNRLVGTWKIEITAMSFHPDPLAVARGQASFSWLEAGAFLLQKTEVTNSDFPRGTSIIGADDSAGTYTMLYFDSRGVSRIYQMSLEGDTLKLWRDFPGFSQRFIGTFGDLDNRITARWEKSSDGSNWEHDFDITYMKSESSI